MRCKQHVTVEKMLEQVSVSFVCILPQMNVLKLDIVSNILLDIYVNIKIDV